MGVNYNPAVFTGATSLDIAETGEVLWFFLTDLTFNMIGIWLSSWLSIIYIKVNYSNQNLSRYQGVIKMFTWNLTSPTYVK